MFCWLVFRIHQGGGREGQRTSTLKSPLQCFIQVFPSGRAKFYFREEGRGQTHSLRPKNCKFLKVEVNLREGGGRALPPPAPRWIKHCFAVSPSSFTSS
jgi:hypothetical protein